MSVLRNTFTVGFFVLVTRITGYLRECVAVHFLSAGMFTDALFVALKLASTFRRIFAEGAFNASFLPRFAKVYHNNGKDEANKMLSDVFSFLLMVLVIFAAIVLLYFPQVLSVLVSGFDVASEKFGLTVSLGRICFPYLIFISIVSLFAGTLNTVEKFALPMGIHAFLNIFIISAFFIAHCFDASNYYMVHAVAISVILCGITQCLVLYANMRKYSLEISFHFNCWTAKVKDVTKNMIPGIISAGVWQLNLLVDMSISSYLPSGTITCVNLADRINQFPLGTLGVALSTALLPPLSKLISSNKLEDAGEEMKRGILFACFVTFFASAVLIALSYPSVAVAFQRGLFSAEHVRITSSALVGFAIGIPAYIMTKIYSSLYFAFGDTKTPVIFGIISVLVNVICLILIVPFGKYFGLALCTSISAIVNASLLIYFSRKKIQISFEKNFFCKILAQIIAGVATYKILAEISAIYWTVELGDQAIKWLIYLGYVALAIASYSVIAILMLKLFRQPEWKIWKRESW